jgi:subtilisin family serine protease
MPGSYLVTLKDTATQRSGGVSDVAQKLAARHGGTVSIVYTAALKGFAIRTSEPAARRLAGDPAVKFVEQDGWMSTAGTQSPTPSWGLDRIDQRNLPLNSSYTYPSIASTVTAYIIDTGIRTTHNDFNGRATWGTNTTGDGNDTDCNGHGTHVAGTTGATSHGVAKGVQLIAVKVLNCSGFGLLAWITAGIDWVTSHHTTGLAVANMSLGGSVSTTIDNAVRNSIADGVVYTLAAGNDNYDACLYSPARTAEAITVGASDSADARASFSNFGTCLDVFAPGVNIVSTYNANNADKTTLSGTSMSAPHAAGVSAMIRAINPSFTPQQVRDRLVADATPGKITNPGAGSPNLLLYVDNAVPPQPPVVVWSDDFETNKGWVRNPNNTDTATGGLWARGTPQQTSYDVYTMQRGDTTSGTQGMFTDPLAGTSAGAGDIDGGVTSVQSPAISLPSGGILTLSFRHYLAHLHNSGTDDFLRVYLVHSAGSNVIYQRFGAALDVSAVWTSGDADVSNVAGQTIRLRFEVGDVGAASLIEAGLDDVQIIRT